jgi:hypothetical protein
MKRQIVKNVLLRVLLRESRVSKFESLVTSGKMTQEQFDLVWDDQRRSWKSPFNDDQFRKILFNSYDQGQDHEIEYFLEKELEIKQKIINPMRQNRMTLPVIEVPGVSIIDLNPRIKPNFLLTIDECTAYIEASLETDSKSKKLKEILYSGLKKRDTTHFEIIHKDQNVIIVYPKTYLGSIATARMGPDLKYYTPGGVIGAMNWCTSIASGNNMFLNYHRKLNLHMYYITKIGSNFSKEDPYRKACVSMLKKYGQVNLADQGGSTVNGNNNSIKEEDIVGAYGQSIYDIIFKDASHAARQEIDEKEYYKSITLGQFKTLEAAAIRSEDENLSVSLFLREVDRIVQHTEKIELLRYIAEFKEYYRESRSRTIFGTCLESIKRNLFSKTEKIFLIEDMLEERKKKYNEDLRGTSQLISGIKDIYDSLDSDVEKRALFEVISKSGNEDIIKMSPLMVGIDQFPASDVAVAMFYGGYRGYNALREVVREKPLQYREVLEEIINIAKGNSETNPDDYYSFSTVGYAAAVIVSYLKPNLDLYSIIPKTFINTKTVDGFVTGIKDTGSREVNYGREYVDDDFNLVVPPEPEAYGSLMITRRKANTLIASALLEYSRHTDGDVPDRLRWMLNSEAMRIKDEYPEVYVTLVEAMYSYKFYNEFIFHLKRSNLKISVIELKNLFEMAKSENFKDIKKLNVSIMNLIINRGLDLSEYLGRSIDDLKPGQNQSNFENIAERMALMTQYFLSIRN